MAVLSGPKIPTENYHFAGKLGNCLVYNKYLEPEEVYDIYRATRSTYLS